MTQKHRFAWSILWLMILANAVEAADTLQVATGKIEITPPAGYAMGGYSARKGVGQGVHDPLLAKVLLIKSGETQLGLVTYDLVGFQSARVAREAKEQLGITYLLQICSHTHSGPVPKDRANPGADPWGNEVENKVIALLKDARSHFVPVQLAVGQARVLLGHNRRKINADGTVTMFWRNAERIPTSPVDPTVGIVSFVDRAGKPVAVLVNYACHAVVLGPDNLQYSADWPGYMYRYVESRLGSPVVCYFAPGASGDINPYDDKQPVAQDGFGVAQKTGERLGEVVVEALGKMPKPDAAAEIRVSQELVDFRDRWDSSRAMPVQVSRVLLGPDTAILAVPAEVFVSHQIDFRVRSPLAHSFIFGYAFGGDGAFAGYIPTIQAAMEGGYGAGYATRIEAGAGERIVDRTIIWIYEQMGKLRDLPDELTRGR